MSNIKLSVVIITLNEEANIRRCLDSVKDIADEILVVDSFSTDATEKICGEYDKVKFVQHEFEGHIEQKNYALSQAAHDHVFSIDADEAITDSLREEIVSIKSSWNADAYFVNRANYYLGKKIRFCGWYPDKKIRLFDKRKAQWSGTNPHDRITMADYSKIIRIHADLNHFSYKTTEEHQVDINKYSTIAAKAAFLKGKKTFLLTLLLYPLFIFIKTYFVQGGIFDGYHGFIISVHNAYYRFLKYLKLRALHHMKKSHHDGEAFNP